MASLAPLIHENPLPPEFELGFVIGLLVMEMAAALADAVFHQHLWAASAMAWVDAYLELFWVRLVANHLIHAGFHYCFRRLNFDLPLRRKASLSKYTERWDKGENDGRYK